MDKKMNTVLFMLLGTVVSVLLTLGIMLVLAVVVILVFQNLPSVLPFALLIAIIGSLVASFFIYHKLVLWATKKFNLDTKLTPLFTNARARKPHD